MSPLCSCFHMTLKLTVFSHFITNKWNESDSLGFSFSSLVPMSQIGWVSSKFLSGEENYSSSLKCTSVQCKVSNSWPKLDKAGWKCDVWNTLSIYLFPSDQKYLGWKYVPYLHPSREQLSSSKEKSKHSILNIPTFKNLWTLPICIYIIYIF